MDLGDEIDETEPSENVGNIDEPVTFQLRDSHEKEDLKLRRDTFVGTPLYVSPEMLQESISLPASDLWALGCIIFKMHTGRNAFMGITEHALFQNILAAELNAKNAKTPLSEELDKDTLDLIKQLLVLEPSMRLGAGKPGSSNDIEALRKHPYFSSIYSKPFKVHDGAESMPLDAPKDLLKCLTDTEEKKSPVIKKDVPKPV